MSIKRFPAELEYKKDPDLSKETVHQLLDWARKQPHLPEITEEDVILFLSSCYHRVEQAKKTIDLYYTIRTHVPEFFENRDPFEKLNAMGLRTILSAFMSGLTDDGQKVIYHKIMDSDPSKYIYSYSAKGLIMCQDLFLLEMGASPGLKIVVDFDGMSMAHFTKIGFFTVKKIFVYLQDAMPVRLDSFHFINAKNLISSILKLIKPFLNQSTADSIHVHHSLDELHQYIPKRMLPLEAGGDLPPLRVVHQQMLEVVEANRDWFKEEGKMRVNESLRPEKAKNSGDLFGSEGSFRKLDID